MHPRLFGVLVLLFAAMPAGAVDYGKIERKLTKEPAYQSKSPKYALLLFGQEAKLRVWAVLDGPEVYLDRNGDGDLTGKNERFQKQAEQRDIEIGDPDGKTNYVVTGVGTHSDRGDPPREYLMLSVDIKGPVAYHQYCDAELRASPAKAAIAHFHGPLSAGPMTINWKLPPKFALKAGDAATEVPALVGTMNAEHGCWVVVRSHNGDTSAFPKGVSPVVAIEYPPKAPGASPIKERYALDKFC